MHLHPFNFNNKDGDRHSRRSQGSDKSLVKIFLTEPFPLPILDLESPGYRDLLVYRIVCDPNCYHTPVWDLIPVLLTCPLFTMTTRLPFALPNQEPPYPRSGSSHPIIVGGFPQGKRILIRTPK